MYGDEYDPEDFENTFYYTHEADTDSSWIPEVYYNENDRSLVINIDPSDSPVDEFRKYDNVPKAVFEEFVGADSVGSYYNRVIKGRYGRGEVLGDYGDVLILNEAHRPEPVAVSAPSVFSENSVGAQSYVTLSTKADEPNIVSGDLKATDLSAPGGYVTLGDASLLSTPAPNRVFNVVFDVTGGGRQDWTVNAPDWNSAEASVVQLGKALGLEFVVKGLAVVG